MRKGGPSGRRVVVAYILGYGAFAAGVWLVTTAGTRASMGVLEGSLLPAEAALSRFRVVSGLLAMVPYGLGGAVTAIVAGGRGLRHGVAFGAMMALVGLMLVLAVGRFAPGAVTTARLPFALACAVVGVVVSGASGLAAERVHRALARRAKVDASGSYT